MNNIAQIIILDVKKEYSLCKLLMIFVIVIGLQYTVSINIPRMIYIAHIPTTHNT